MSRTILIAECATGHGGDLSIAEDMIAAAADSGADYVKFQTYSLAKLNPRDPQRGWLTQAHLDRAAHERLMAHCQTRGTQFLSTPFDADSLQMLRDLGLTTFKIASSESGNDWWSMLAGECWFVSYPWGIVTPDYCERPAHHALTAIPMYPTPLECVGRATLLDGWSDHCASLDACLWAIAQGVQVIEAHLTLGDGRGRRMPWDKTPENIKQIRDFADKIATIRTGVSTQFRERWSA